MCGRAYRTTPAGNLAKHFEAELGADFEASYNIGPTADVAAIRVNKDGGRELTSLYWGLIPAWAKDDGKRRPSLHNAKAETAHEKPSFRSAFKKRRCLILFDGFFEWLREDAKNKRPFLVRRKDGAPMAMAGLWEFNGTFDLRSGAVLTTAANALLQEVHTRMPVILEPAAQQLWLTEDAEVPALRELLVPSSPEILEMYEVSPQVGSIRNNSPACVERLDSGSKEM